LTQPLKTLIFKVSSFAAAFFGYVFYKCQKIISAKQMIFEKFDEVPEISVRRLFDKMNSLRSREISRQKGVRQLIPGSQSKL
jgi:hypothetical protein